MAWKVTIGDRSMLLDDLSQDDFIAATLPHDGVNWLTLYVSPGSHPGALYDLLCAIAFKLEVPPPPRPTTIKDAVKLLEYVERVDDDLPNDFAEGGLPFEIPEDATETTTSSTSTEPEDGLPNKPDEPH